MAKEASVHMSPDWYDRFVEEVKGFYPLAKKPRRNKLGDVVIGHNHPVHSSEKKDDLQSLLINDVDYTLTHTHKHFKNYNSIHPVRRNVLCHILFYLGENRLKGWKEFIEAVEMENWARAALTLVNSKFYRNDPTTAKKLAERLLKTR